ncbi:MAG TPA: hypothetical protein VJ765_00780 [Chitinophagaceae bacterium]|nr:hypothetical protein [Chitinophagaceae bacterium]
MEVHHHAHTSRKRWTHYFWEFLMLFLAVFCGFLAEYQLEHKIERDRVKEYAAQMVEGLKKDTAQLNYVIGFNQDKFKRFDSLSIILGYPENSRELWNGLYRHVHILFQRRRYNPTTSIFDQVNNTGALRYFKNRELVSKILDYKSRMDLIMQQDEGEKEVVIGRIEPFIIRHFMLNRLIQRHDSYIATPGWDSTKIGQAPITGFFNAEPGTMLEFQNHVINAKGAAQLPANNKVSQLKRAEALILLLQKEYHLR